MWPPALVFLAIWVGEAWNDACAPDGDISKYRDVLCPDIFQVSRLAFNPHGPGLRSEITLVVAPSVAIGSTTTTTQHLHLQLPGFGIPDDMPQFQGDASQRIVAVVGSNYVSVNEDPLFAYNSDVNPVLMHSGLFYKDSSRLELTIQAQKSVAPIDTEFRICCFTLPTSLPKDSTSLTITALTTGQTSDIQIAMQSIKNTPQITRGNYWKHSRILFDPPASSALTRISVKVQLAATIEPGARINVLLPTITRAVNESGELEFNMEGVDWLKFLHKGYWDKEQSTMSFYLRPGVSLEGGHLVTFRTANNAFRLPMKAEPNWSGFQVEARSADGVDEVVPRTPVKQSDHVAHIRTFTLSELSYSNNVALQYSDVTIQFRTNQPSFKGSEIYLRLAGFSSEVLEILLEGPYKNYFLKQMAIFDLPKNVITLLVSKTLYSNEETVSVTFLSLRLPPALYENDISLLLWTSDFGAEKIVVQKSPEIVDLMHGPKKFIRSKILFDPVPNKKSNLTFILQPSVSFYQGDVILLHLYGFSCSQSDFPLEGDDTLLFEKGMANWNPATSTITLRVAEGKIVSRTRPTVIQVPGEQINFRLPDKLSENDGTLMIQGLGAYIKKEAIKSCPSLGLPKRVTYSSLEFHPCSTCKGILEENNAKVFFSFILNSDILSNSTIYFKLSGISRAHLQYCCDASGLECKRWCPEASGYVRLSGRNAPMFRDSMGHFDAMNQLLSVQIIEEVTIPAGDKTQFFLEEDQLFFMPYAMEQSDPSLYLYIPEAGITKHFFDFTTRINRFAKEFMVSELKYGEENAVAYPNSNTQIFLHFRPNVDLPPGTIIRVHLPNFRSAKEKVRLKSIVDYDLKGATYKNFKYDSELGYWYGTWSQSMEALDLEVDEGKYISKDIVTKMRLPKVEAGFQLPNGLQPNDDSLQIETINNQIIRKNKILKSPLVVDRAFQVSKFVYLPNEKESYFMLKMKLQPTVDIASDETIIITLPNFRNKLGKTSLHLTGPSASLVQSTAVWNQQTFTLSFAPPKRNVLKAFEMIELVIPESQGFILPNKLFENDKSLTIESLNNIQRQGEPLEILESMMVGDGPDENQRICMFQNELGARTTDPFCDNPSCLTEKIDSCSESELLRCSCRGRISQQHVPLTIHGFQFKINDTINFVLHEQSCDDPSQYLDVFDRELVYKDMNHGENRFRFHSMRATQTGYFRMCFAHMGLTKDIGTITVRPACTIPFVLVEGACVTYCPSTKIPMTGECKRDPVILSPNVGQAVMVSVVMTNPDDVAYKVWNKYITGTTEERPERTYFEYRFRYDIARVLNAAPERFLVASIMEGPTNTSFYVNAVFKPSILGSQRRTPMGLYSLFNALIDEEDSILWKGEFLRFIDRNQVSKPMQVSLCEDSVYRTMCPYVQIGKDASSVPIVFFLVVFGAALLVVIFGCLVWRVDYEQAPSKKETEEVDRAISKPVFQMDPNTKTEFARSWVESRYYGESRNGFSLAKEKLGRVMMESQEKRKKSFSVFLHGASK